MALFGQSLDPTSTTGPGRAVEPDHPQTAARVTVLLDIQNGNPSAFELDLEGSIDGINWRKEFAFVYPGDAGTPFRHGTATPYTVTGGHAQRAYRMFRANLVSFSDPGGTVTVSAAISILPT